MTAGPDAYMRLMRCAWLVGVSIVLAAAHAHADDETLDFRAPVRVGVGFSGPYDSPMVSVSYHDQVRVARITKWLGFELLAGVDGVGIVSEKLHSSDGSTVGYTAAELGMGLSFRSPNGGALFVVSGALGPIIDDNGQDSRVAGFGFSTRTEVYPLYLDVYEAVECKRGPAYTYMASSLNFWTVLRGDFVEGASAASWAVGFGVDIVRSVLLPVVGVVLKGSCSKKHSRQQIDY